MSLRVEKRPRRIYRSARARNRAVPAWMVQSPGSRRSGVGTARRTMSGSASSCGEPHGDSWPPCPAVNRSSIPISSSTSRTSTASISTRRVPAARRGIWRGPGEWPSRRPQWAGCFPRTKRSIAAGFTNYHWLPAVLEELGDVHVEPDVDPSRRPFERLDRGALAIALTTVPPSVDSSGSASCSTTRSPASCGRTMHWREGDGSRRRTSGISRSSSSIGSAGPVTLLHRGRFEVRPRAGFRRNVVDDIGPATIELVRAIETRTRARKDGANEV